MDVSQLILGGMSFGDSTKGHHKWVLDETKTRSMIKLALDKGINFFDTANIYAGGTSEEYMGRALNDMADRDEIVVATKVFFKDSDRPNARGLSRKTIFSEIDKSLKRLNMDYVDLYIIHRWDYGTPIEETMEALDDLIKAGKVRYIGASAMYAWQFQKALFTADKHGLSRFVSMQNHYNLIYREEEREMIPLCREQGVAVTPYSPLAGGKLTKPAGEHTLRSDTDIILKQKYGHCEAEDRVIINRVGELAEKYAVKYAQIALAWLLQKDGITSPIVGATREEHLLDAVAALEIELTDEDIYYLEEEYIPHRIVGAL